MQLGKAARIVFLAGCGLALSTLAAAQLTAPGASGAGAPAVVFTEKTHEFPPVIDGTHVVHDFVVANKGNAPLLIDAVRTG